MKKEIFALVLCCLGQNGFAADVSADAGSVKSEHIDEYNRVDRHIKKSVTVVQSSLSEKLDLKEVLIGLHDNSFIKDFLGNKESGRSLPDMYVFWRPNDEEKRRLPRLIADGAYYNRAIFREDSTLLCKVDEDDKVRHLLLVCGAGESEFYNA